MQSKCRGGKGPSYADCVTANASASMPVVSFQRHCTKAPLITKVEKHFSSPQLGGTGPAASRKNGQAGMKRNRGNPFEGSSAAVPLQRGDA